jgi:hypothetical protein
MMQEGIPVVVISGYLGMTVQTLMKVYGYLRPEHLEEAQDFGNRRFVNTSREQIALLTKRNWRLIKGMTLTCVVGSE